MSLPIAFLEIHTELRLAICVECGIAYGHDRLRRHLKKVHKISAWSHPGLVPYLAGLDLLPSSRLCPRPPDGLVRIKGLTVWGALLCSSCRFLSINKDVMTEHRKQHHVRESPPPTHVRVQTLSAFKTWIDYFVVVEPYFRQPAPVPNLGPSGVSLRALMEDIKHARPVPSTTVPAADHADVNTRWFALTGFRHFLQGVDMEKLSPMAQIPVPMNLRLARICGSVERNLRAAMDLLVWRELGEFHLSDRDAFRLNAFHPTDRSGDPIKYLQEAHSRSDYICVAKRLVCFYAQNADGKFGDKTLFEPSAELAQSWAAVNAAETEDELDLCVRAFTSFLVVHDTPARTPFVSPLYAFAAVAFWHPRELLAPNMNTYSSFLSKLVYVGQMWLLEYCLGISADNLALFSPTLEAVCARWLVNDQDAPLSQLLRIRPLAFKIAQDQIVELQITWSADYEELTYGSVTVQISQIRALVHHQCRRARLLFERDLCFDMPLPHYELDRVQDNWSDRTACYSFVSDPRNAPLFFEHEYRLLAHLDATHGSHFWTPTGPDSFAFKLDTIERYEAAVQNFLHTLSICIYLGSGQPPRVNEFLTLRWYNGIDGHRNIRVHNGFVKFMITYHKSRNRTDQDYHPVRVLLPEIGLLFVQFLVLVQPFRQALLAKVPQQSCPEGRLWVADGSLWQRPHFTQRMKDASEAAIAVSIMPSVWRQLAKAMAVEKVRAYARLLTPTAAAADDDDDEDHLPNVFHLQAAHSVRTGNRMYGQSIGYDRSLTDKDMHQYTAASQAWHAFLQRTPDEAGRQRQQEAQQAAVLRAETSLATQLCLAAPFRHRWSAAEAQHALCHVHGSQARFRSEKQREMVQAMVDGVTPIVAVLGTGAGKSLAYQVYQALPLAATCVLVLPLVALKQDTVRRCTALRIPYTEWNGQTLPASTARLVLVSIEDAVGELFTAFLAGLNTQHRLGAVFFDECHLALTAASYRDVMAKVKRLRFHRCALFYLTGTLPPVLQPALQEQLGLAKPCWIRGTTIRSDIRYQVTVLYGSNWLRQAVERIRTTAAQLASDERVLVYCTSVAEVHSVAELLQCPAYHASSLDKDALFCGWIAGEHKVLVGTSALSEGIDYAHVRHTFHVNAVYGAIDLAQSSGRGGRDGRGSTAHILLPHLWESRWRSTHADADRQALRDMLSTKLCRTLVLAAYLDNAPFACTTHLCDLCQQTQKGDLLHAGYRHYVAHRSTALHVSEDDGDVLASRERLLQKPALQRQAFRTLLQAFSRSCLLCLAHGDLTGRQHELMQCPSPRRALFLDDMGKRGHWIASYAACFQCGLPQEICSRPDPETSTERCAYPDLLFPLLWSIHKVPAWHSLLPNDIRGATDARFFHWAGQPCESFGMDATHMVSVCSDALQHLFRRSGNR